MDKENQRTLDLFNDMESGLGKVEQDNGDVIVEKSKIIGDPKANVVGKTQLYSTGQEATQAARFRAVLLQEPFKEKGELTGEEEEEIDDVIADSFGERYIDSKLGLDDG